MANEKKFGPGIKSGPVAIGIDQSLTGFALTILNVNAPEQFNSWVYKSPYFGVQRLSDIGGWLVDKLETVKDEYIQDIAMEAAIMASPSSLKLGELAALVKLTLWDYFMDYDHQDHLRTPLLIPPTVVKKFASGKGNAKKQEMLMQIYKRWGIEFNDDNAADAYALARMASGKAQGAIETAVIEQIKDVKYRDTIL